LVVKVKAGLVSRVNNSSILLPGVRFAPTRVCRKHEVDNCTDCFSATALKLCYDKQAEEMAQLIRKLQEEEYAELVRKGLIPTPPPTDELEIIKQEVERLERVRKEKAEAIKRKTVSKKRI